MLRHWVIRFRKAQSNATALLERTRGIVRDESQWPRTRQFVHFWIFVGRNFVHNRCLVRASALAYTTLLALVPMLAIAVSVSTSLLRESGAEPIQEFIEETVKRFAPQIQQVGAVENAGPDGADGEGKASEGSSGESTNATDRIGESDGPANGVESPVPSEGAMGTNAVSTAGSAKAGTGVGEPVVQGAEEFANRISDYINNIQSGALGATSMLVLVLVAISLLRTIEATFNDIWGVEEGRSIMSSIVQYWTAITLGPLLLTFSVSMRASVKFSGMMLWIQDLPAGIGDVLTYLFGIFIPIILLCGAFTLLYLLMPNTSVRWNAALVGGLVGAILLHLNSQLNVIYVSQVVTYTNIYGSLGVLPLFLIGLYVSWLILLLGAQVAYSFQNRHVYAQERQVERVNQDGRELAALRLLAMITENFLQGKCAATTQEMADVVGVPVRLVSQVIAVLEDENLVVELADPESGYVPARPPAQISIHQVLRAMRSARGDIPEMRSDELHSQILAVWGTVQGAEGKAAQPVTMQHLVDRTRSVPATSRSA